MTQETTKKQLSIVLGEPDLRLEEIKVEQVVLNRSGPDCRRSKTIRGVGGCEDEYS